nr:glycosyltransferase family 4 protein [uncultured Noviherbaspirillum sp.]
MNLLVYLHSMNGGGAERVTANLANYWAAQGWTITIATIEPASRDFYELHPAIQRVELGLAARGNGLVEALTRNLARIRTLRGLILEVRPDAVLSMMTNANVILALACRGLPNVCAVGSERHYPGHVWLNPIWSLLRRIHYGGLQAVVAQTSECAAWILQHTRARQAPVIPNSATWPMPAQSPLVEPDKICRPGRRILLGAGRLVEQKNFAVLVEVFARIAAKHPDWDLVILGKGPLHDDLRRQAGAAGLGDRVFLPGLVGNLGDWYAQSDLYVMTSHFEGFPNTLVEALAHGVPVVSYDCDTGPRDIIRHGVDGLLIPLGDAQALHDGLDTVMGNEALRCRLAARAGEARERFSIERVAAMWEALFRQGVPHAGMRARSSTPEAARQDCLQRNAGG